MDITPYTLSKSDQLNADDLLGSTIDIKITNVTHGTSDQPIVIEYENDNGRPWKPCKSMLRVLKFCWGNNGNDWVGRRARLYRDADVTWGGVKVGGVRVSHVSHIKSKQILALTARKGAKATYKVEPLEDEPEATPELIQAGEDAAKGGVESYTKWLSGLGDNKPLVKPHHDKWSKIAKEADADELPSV